MVVFMVECLQMTLDLFLDTSTDRGLLAIVDQGAIVEEQQLHAGPFSSSSILPSLVNLLGKRGFSLQQFDRFIAGIGPGSFTGIRVAVSIQQSLAFAQGLPWFGWSSLHLWTPAEPGRFVAMVDARSGGIYCQAAEWQPGSYTVHEPAQRLSVEDAQVLARRFDGRIATPHAPPLVARLDDDLLIEQVQPSLKRIIGQVHAAERPAILYGSEMRPQPTSI
jgi:tRNA threonylcarbamoyl adenosine modification protein YeaZ